MQVHRGIPEHADTAAVLTIGNFDGVHLGHQALLSLLSGKARELGLPAVVLTFEPHPREYFSPADAPARLASLGEINVMVTDRPLPQALAQRCAEWGTEVVVAAG